MILTIVRACSSYLYAITFFPELTCAESGKLCQYLFAIHTVPTVLAFGQEAIHFALGKLACGFVLGKRIQSGSENRFGAGIPPRCHALFDGLQY